MYRKRHKEFFGLAIALILFLSLSAAMTGIICKPYDITSNTLVVKRNTAVCVETRINTYSDPGQPNEVVSEYYTPSEDKEQ